jgi:hypothetical protein
MEAVLKKYKKMKDDLKEIKWMDTGRLPQFFFNQQHSTGNLTNTMTENILAQMKKSTLIGCDIKVN